MLLIRNLSEKLTVYVDYKYSVFVINWTDSQRKHQNRVVYEVKLDTYLIQKFCVLVNFISYCHTVKTGLSKCKYRNRCKEVNSCLHYV